MANFSFLQIPEDSVQFCAQSTVRESLGSSVEMNMDTFLVLYRSCFDRLSRGIPRWHLVSYIFRSYTGYLADFVVSLGATLTAKIISHRPFSIDEVGQEISPNVWS